MSPLRFLQALRHPRALAIMASLNAHVVVAAAGYAYVSWPSSPTIMVIPIEVVASPFGPGGGSTADVTASDSAGGEQAASDVEPAGSPDEETVSGDQPSERPSESPDRITSEATPATLPTQPPENDAGDSEVVSEGAPPHASVAVADPIIPIIRTEPRPPHLAAEMLPEDAVTEAASAAEQNDATTRAPAAILEAGWDDPSPVLVKAIDPPSQVRPEIDLAALSIVVALDSSSAVPPPQPKQQVDPLPLPVVQQPVSAPIAPPRIVTPTMSPRLRSKPDVVVAKRPPLPRTRPAELLPVRATSTPAPVAQAQRPAMRLPRPRPTLQVASKILAHSPTKLPTEISPDRKLLRASVRSAPTESSTPSKSNIPTTGRNIETARRGGPTETTVAPDADPGNGVGAASGTDLRPLPGNPAPRYPRLARERGWQGRVVLEVAVIGDGTVNHAEIDQSSGYRVLDQAALQVVRRWRFAVDQPRLPNGAVVRVPITFKLSD